MEAGNWIALAALAFTVLNALVLYLTNASRASKREMTEHGSRLTKLEAIVEALPSKDKFHELEIMVTRVESNQRVFEAELKPIALAVGRIEKFLIESVTPKRKP